MRHVFREDIDGPGLEDLQVFGGAVWEGSSEGSGGSQESTTTSGGAGRGCRLVRVGPGRLRTGLRVPRER